MILEQACLSPLIHLILSINMLLDVSRCFQMTQSNHYESSEFGISLFVTKAMPTILINNAQKWIFDTINDRFPVLFTINCDLQAPIYPKFLHVKSRCQRAISDTLLTLCLICSWSAEPVLLSAKHEFACLCIPGCFRIYVFPLASIHSPT